MKKIIIPIDSSFQKKLTPIEFDKRVGKYKVLKNMLPTELYKKVKLLKLKNKVYSESVECQGYHNGIFIHIPKAGGQSIYSAVFGSGLISPGHRSVAFYKALNQSLFDKAFVFSFVREPMDRIYSAFSYLKFKTKYQKDIEWKNLYLSKINSFEEFVVELEGKKFRQKVMNQVHFRPQIEFLINNEGQVEIDFLGRFENFAEDFEKLTNLIGIKKYLPHKNKGVGGNNKYFSDEMIKIISDIYQVDYKYLGYELPSCK